jgi:nicotinamidase-related amidase
LNQLPQVLTTLREKVAPAHTAVLAIDMVNDFLDPAGKTPTRAGRPLDGARAAIGPMKEVLDRSRDVGAGVVYVQHTTMADGSSSSGPWIDARSRATYSVDDICLDGTWGQAIIKELAPEPADAIIQKYRYSGFAGTRLDAYLRSRGVRTVICTGVSTNVCVEATAREAFSLDYYVVYVSDACASWDMDRHDATLRSAGHRYATVCSSQGLFEAWSEV